MSSESEFSDYWQTLSKPKMKMEKEDGNVTARLFSVRLNLTRTNLQPKMTARVREMKSKTMEPCISNSIFQKYVKKNFAS